MPTNFFSVDSSFPDLNNKTQDQINIDLQNYLYMLLEQLRYTLSNLGVNNFNTTSLAEIGEMINGNFVLRIEDVEGNVSMLTQSVDGFETRVSNAEGSVSTLTQKVDGFGTRVSNAEGDISVLEQRFEGFKTRVSNVEGNVSTLTQTVSGFETRVSNAEGDVSTLTQTVEGFKTRVSNAEGDIFVLQQSYEGFSSRVTNVENDSTLIKQNALQIALEVRDNSILIDQLGTKITGMVTIQDLMGEGTTIINGSNIKTGTINAVDLNGCKFTSTSESGKVMILASGSVTVYNGNFPVGGQYISGQNEYVIYGTGLVLEGVPYVREVAGGSKYKVLHLGNIAENASAIRTALGI